MTPEPYLMLEDRTDPKNVEFVEFVETLPIPLDRDVDTPDFPFYALPKPFGEFVYALSESTQTDPGLAGSAVVAALSAALGGYVKVQVRPGYSEPTNVWTLGVAPSGDRKSSVVRAALDPLYAAEKELHEKMAPVLSERAVQRDIAERAAEKAKRDAGNAANAETRNKLTSEASTLAGQAAGMKVQAAPRIIGDDVTIEALVSHLAEQNGRFAVISAEGGLFTGLSGRYSDKVDITPVLKAHAGDRIRVDRKGRDSEFVDDPALTVGIMIQPGILAEATANRTFVASGLMARFLYSWPRSKVGRRNVDPAPVSQDLSKRYWDALYSLACGVREGDGTRTLTLSAEADAARLAYATKVEHELGPGGSLAHMDGWASKVVGASIRMAGLFHAASDKDSDIITGNAMDSGILLAEYYTKHATKVFDGLSESAAEHALARRVLELIIRKDMDYFTNRDIVMAATRSWCPNKETAQQAINVLEGLGWLFKEQPEAGGGRKSAIQYRVHPTAWNQEQPPHSPQSPQSHADVEVVEVVEAPQAPYDTEPRCPTHRTIIGPSGKCIECITEAATIKVQETAA